MIVTCKIVLFYERIEFFLVSSVVLNVFSYPSLAYERHGIRTTATWTTAVWTIATQDNCKFVLIKNINY